MRHEVLGRQVTTRLSTCREARRPTGESVSTALFRATGSPVVSKPRFFVGARFAGTGATKSLMILVYMSVVSCGASRPRDQVIDIDVPNAPSASATTVTIVPPRVSEARDAQAVQWLAWEPGIEARARSERRPLFVYAYADWCMTCKELDRRVFSDEDVKRASASFLMLKLDLTDTDNPDVEEMSRAFPITTMPSILLIDEVTGARSEIAGFVDAPALTERMRLFAHRR